MKRQLIAAIAVTGALSLALASPAWAATASHPKPHKTKTVTQITGKKLAKGLLPGSAFGFGMSTSDEADTGKKLLPPHPLASVSSEPCGDLLSFLPLFGQTAVAEDSIDNSSLGGVQAISQFAGAAAAWSFYGHLEAKYNSCTAYSTAVKGDQSTGPLTLSINLNSVSNTKVDGSYAFAVSQVVEISDSFGDVTLSMDAKVVAAGRNVYLIWISGDTDTPVPNGWLTSLIKRTKALYKS